MKLKRSVVVILLITLTTAGSMYLYSSGNLTKKANPVPICCDKDKSVSKVEPLDSPPKGCVFKTVFEGEYLDSDFRYKTPERVRGSIQRALVWMISEQLPDGGWSGGFHATQQILKDPNAKSDPGTTAFVSMAILRCGTSPAEGPYEQQLNKATEFLLQAVETSPDNDPNITRITGTQPQVKLGQNIDVMLTSQFLTNILDYFVEGTPKRIRVKNCIDKCVAKIQRAQNNNGSFSGAGWAGVLQSSIANNALETAATKGIKVDTAVLEKSKSYQSGNYSVPTGAVTSGDGTGVMLYSLSSTSRASSKDALYAKKMITKAKKEGKIKATDKVSYENLQKAGLSEDQALKYNTAYEINDAAGKKAQEDDVMSGFGNNGGEEFYSFLQTGEGLIISHDKAWKEWYDKVSGKLIKIQENKGNWQGHHCITSPAFCTAACLLILSVDNDIEKLVAMGVN